MAPLLPPPGEKAEVWERWRSRRVWKCGRWKMWKKTCWKERFQLGVAYWPLQGGHAKTFLTTVCCFGFSCSRLYENRQQTAAMQDWDILYTQTAHILYRGSKCCTHWPQIGGAGDTGHTHPTLQFHKNSHICIIASKYPYIVLVGPKSYTAQVCKSNNPTLLLPLTICSYLYQHSTGQIKHSVFCTFGSTLAGRRSCRPKGSSSTL